MKEIKLPIAEQVQGYKKRHDVEHSKVQSLVGNLEKDSSTRDYMPRTKFETVAQRVSLNKRENEAKQILHAYGRDSSSLYFANVICPCFNAQTMPMEFLNSKLKDHWLVEFNNGFNELVHKMSLLSANLCPSTGNLDSISLDLQQYTDLFFDEKDQLTTKSYFGLLLSDLLIELNIEGDSINLNNCKNLIVAASLSSGISDFTLYHELAHIILKHHAKLNQLSFVEGQKQEKVKVPNYYDFEYEADSLGLLIMFDRLGDEKSIIKEKPYSAVTTPYVYSPLIFFSWLNAFQTFEDTISKKYRGIETHPQAMDRRFHLRELYKKFGLINESSLNFADILGVGILAYYDFSKQYLTPETLKAIRSARNKLKTCRVD